MWSNLCTKSKWPFTRGAICAISGARHKLKRLKIGPSSMAPPRPANRISPDAPICVTMGEPSGIGPEVAVAAFQSLGSKLGERPIKLVGDPRVFLACAPIPPEAIVGSHPVAVPRNPGVADSQNTRAVVDAV